jgi:hypothetical protein
VGWFQLFPILLLYGVDMTSYVVEDSAYCVAYAAYHESILLNLGVIEKAMI